jgi:AcrR family transcriptional regulator
MVERIKERVLSQVRPDGFGAPSPKWQQRKSAEMRVRILEATVDCLVALGYSGLSISEVTQHAGISRGAMHHHFTSRMALVGAVAEYVFFRRMHNFLEDYFEEVAKRGDEKIVEIASDMHWRSVQTREYAAFIELAVAARTDSELNAFFAPAERQFDKVWTREMIRSFPQWEAHWDQLQVASDFAMAAHMGLLLHQPVFGRGKRAAAVLDQIAIAVKALHARLNMGDTK